jgi:hypothetical protein
MANLIKRIAVSASRRNGANSAAEEFKSSTNTSATHKATLRRSSIHELASIVSYTGEAKADRDRTISFQPTGNQIKSTQTVTVTSEPSIMFQQNEARGGAAAWGRRGSDVEITGNVHAYAANSQGVKGSIPGIIVEEGSESTPRTKSLDSSVKSGEAGTGGKRAEDSDDEAALVGRGRVWGRGPS